MATSIPPPIYPDEALGASGLLGIWQLLKFSRKPIEFSVKSAQEYGDAARISIGSIHVYIFHHPDLISEVLSKKNEHFIKDISYRSLAGFLGNGLLLIDGEHWQKHRRLMQPAFTQDKVSTYRTHLRSFA